ncbi:MAG: EFR1 family ferrodoxin [Bacillota bacterium]|nr:EFR1 family ferrodoxin [Bacillota bacterium]
MKAIACYFSGTDTTKKIVECITRTISNILQIEMTIDDFTKPGRRDEPLHFDSGDIVVLGMPVIAGRVPNLMLPNLGQMRAEGAFGIPVVLYGNRNYDDALVELADIMKEAGMTLAGAGAFIGEHSFSTVLGAGRPDASDMQIAEEFGRAVARKVQERETGEFFIRGENPIRPYYQPRDRNGNPIDIRKVKPKTNERCNQCGLCVSLCPLGSIDPDDVTHIRGICMKCCACIKKCPQQAKYFDDAGYIYHMHELEEMYAATRREPEVFY